MYINLLWIWDCFGNPRVRSSGALSFRHLYLITQSLNFDFCPGNWKIWDPPKYDRNSSNQKLSWLGSYGLFTVSLCFYLRYRKIPKISPSKYKPPKPVTQKTLRLIAPPNISQLGGLYLEIALKNKVKQSKNGKFPSNYKLVQSILKRKFPSVHKPLRI